MFETFLKTDKGYVGTTVEKEDFEILEYIVSREPNSVDGQVETAKEVAKLLTKIIGSKNQIGFYNWLMVNYDNGNGYNADVVRNAVLYMIGRVGYRALATSLSVSKYSNRTSLGRVNEPLELTEEEKSRLDPSKLFLGIGIVGVAKFLLLFGYDKVNTKIERIIPPNKPKSMRG